MLLNSFFSGILDNYFKLKRKVSKLGCQFGTRSRDQYSSIEGPYPKRHAIFYPGSWKTVTACAAYPFEPILQTLAQDLQTLTHLIIDESDGALIETFWFMLVDQHFEFRSLAIHPWLSHVEIRRSRCEEGGLSDVAMGDLSGHGCTSPDIETSDWCPDLL